MTSRLDQLKIKKKTSYNNGITTVITDFTTKEEKILVVDFDSIIHAAIYPRVDEGRPEYTLDEIDSIIMPKIKVKLFSIEEEVGNFFTVKSTYCFIGSTNNNRKRIDPSYKKNRATPPSVYSEVVNKCIKELGVRRASNGLEADDELANISKIYKEHVILAYIDKDLKQIPGINYNYNKNTWTLITEEEAAYQLAMQICVGDRGDNVIVNKGCGPSRLSKYIKKGMTKYQYIKGIIKCYKHYNKTLVDVKPLIRKTYKLIKVGL